MEWREGGCHCKRVRFRVQSNFDMGYSCNCSVCKMKGYLHLIVKKEQFELLSGEDELISYKFNTRVADHLFCKHCGICSYYIPRSHPDGYSVNIRCIDNVDLANFYIEPFDGKDWEKSAKKIK